MPKIPDIPENRPLSDPAAVPAEATPPPGKGEPESVKTAQVPEIAKEQETMLDVHPAHHAASSWKEFFIQSQRLCLGY
jgi:hypothetical protein